MKTPLLKVFWLLGMLSFLFSAFPDEWDPPSVGPAFTWTANHCEENKLTIQPLFFYVNVRGSYDEDSHYQSLPRGQKADQFQEQLLLQYGIRDRLEFDVQWLYQQNHYKDLYSESHAQGLGDSNLFLHYCLHKEDSDLPHITTLVQLKIPTGKYQHLDPDKNGTDEMGTGSWDPGIGILVSKNIHPFKIHANAILSVPLETTVDGTKTEYGSYFNGNIAAEYFLPRGFNVLVECNNYIQGKTKADGESIPESNSDYYAWVIGFGWSNENFQTLLAWQESFKGTNTTASDLLVLTFTYTL